MSQKQGQSLEALEALEALLPAPVYVVHYIFFHHKILLSPGNFVGFWVSSILMTIAFFSAESEYFLSIPFISFYQINKPTYFLS